MPLQLKIYGLDCAQEVAVLKREIGPLVGGEQRLQFDILRARMTVDAPAGLDPGRVVDAVARTGMRAEPWSEGRSGPDVHTGFWQRRAKTLATVASGILTLAAFSVHARVIGTVSGALGAHSFADGLEVPAISRLIYALAVVAGGWFVAPKAWLAVRRLRPDMNLLMSAAVIGAIVIGEWFEAATVAFLFSTALALESWSIGRARRAVESLMQLAPAVAHLQDPEARYRDVLPEDVPVGGMVLVRPGERIPLDGLVQTGPECGQPSTYYWREHTDRQVPGRRGVRGHDQRQRRDRS